MRMTEYQRKLVESHLEIVDRTIRTRISVSNQPLLSYEDLYQIGSEALCKAAMQYEPARGSFEAIGSRYVYNALIDHCRIQNRARSHIADLDDDTSFELFGPSEETDYDGVLVGKELHELLVECEKRHSGIVRRGIEAIRLKSLGVSTEQIAVKYGTNIENVNAWISRARKRLGEDTRLSAIVSDSL